MDSELDGLRLIAALAHERVLLSKENDQLRSTVEHQERLLTAAAEVVRGKDKTPSSV